MINAVVCTDFSSKKPHRKVGMVTAIASGSLDRVVVSSKELHRQELTRVIASGSLGSRMVSIVICTDFSSKGSSH